MENISLSGDTLKGETEDNEDGKNKKTKKTSKS